MYWSLDLSLFHNTSIMLPQFLLVLKCGPLVPIKSLKFSKLFSDSPLYSKTFFVANLDEESREVDVSTDLKIRRLRILKIRSIVSLKSSYSIAIISHKPQIIFSTFLPSAINLYLLERHSTRNIPLTIITFQFN